MKPKKSLTYPKQKINKNLLVLRDIAIALDYGSVAADKRVQIKMPSEIVKQLDTAFPNTDRSKVITQLVVEALIRHFSFSDPNLRINIQEEQHDLDTMWNYLEKRDFS